MSQLQMKPQTRQNLASMDLHSFFQNAHLPNMKKVLIIGLIGLVVAVVPWILAAVITLEPGSETLEVVTWISVAVTIIGVFFLVIALIAPSMAKKQRRMLQKDIERIERNHGGIAKVTGEIKSQLGQSNLPTYTIQSGQHLTKDWFFGADRTPARIVHLGDVVCIIGIMGAGTFIITSDGEEIPVMFGPKQWAESFALFQAANPRVMSNDDKVTLTGGGDADAETAYRKKDFAAIAATFKNSRI